MGIKCCGYAASLGCDKNVLELVSGDGCTALYTELYSFKRVSVMVCEYFKNYYKMMDYTYMIALHPLKMSFLMLKLSYL